jgi:glucose-6-phosphate isomerase
VKRVVCGGFAESSAALQFLLQLAYESELRARIDAMFLADKINMTEKRTILRVALSAPTGATFLVDVKKRCPRCARGPRQDALL